LSQKQPIVIIVQNDTEAAKLEYLLLSLHNWLKTYKYDNFVSEMPRINQIKVTNKVGVLIDSNSIIFNSDVLPKHKLALTYKILFNAANYDIIILPLRLAVLPAVLKSRNYAKPFMMKLGANYKFAELTKQLVSLGYVRVDIVQEPGEFAIRGGIIDIYEAATNYACRLDFFGETLESIKQLDILTQRSSKSQTSYLISPIVNFFTNKNNPLAVNLLDYLGKTHRIVVPDYELIESFYKDFQEICEFYLTNNNQITNNQILGDFSVNNKFDYDLIKQSKTDSQLNKKNKLHYNDYYFDFNELINNQILNILLISPFSDTDNQLDSQKFLNNMVAKIPQTIINFLDNLPNGFQANISKAVNSKNIINPLELIAGDILVHQRYGIGRYLGLAKRYIGSDKKRYQEYVEIEYAGRYKDNDLLLVSTSSLDQITKYIGHDNPRLSKLGTSHWQKARRDARYLARRITEQLVKLYTKRLATTGFAFGSDSQAQKNFEDEFEFVETSDQLKTIKQVKDDMEAPYPMDRLICGDVGYGKTEIAFRAAFKAVDNAKQVVILAPTTLLVNQHYETCLKRFSNTDRKSVV
jgi:transcription-repair coupling factor (superfamily II helicase)